MSTIYRKTDKGRVEIETRAHRLPPRLRSALILVDGQRDDDALAALIRQSDDVLDELISRGFIEATPPPTPQPATKSAAPPPTLAESSSITTRRREAVRMLSAAVGPMGDLLAIRIEKASDEMTLRPLLVLARDSIRNVRGAAAADAFATRFLT
jgi:hypothetical protein